ncbi:rCG22384, partial [Rattus norvegicus]
METKKHKIAKAITYNNRTSKGITVYYFRLYYRAIVI